MDKETIEELLNIAKAYRNHLRVAAHTEDEVRTFHHIEAVLEKADRKTYLSGEGSRRHWRFVKTGEFRAPKKGEWYLSGAVPEAWQAKGDLETAYHILRRIS